MAGRPLAARYESYYLKCLCEALQVCEIKVKNPLHLATLSANGGHPCQAPAAAALISSTSVKGLTSPCGETEAFVGHLETTNAEDKRQQLCRR